MSTQWDDKPTRDQLHKRLDAARVAVSNRFKEVSTNWGDPLDGVDLDYHRALIKAHVHVRGIQNEISTAACRVDAHQAWKILWLADRLAWELREEAESS